MQRWTIGVDFGGTNTKVGIVSASGRVAAMRRLPSAGFRRPSQFVDAVSAAVEALAAAVGTRLGRLRGIGVGAPGSVDAARGIVHSMVNVPGWRNVPLRGMFERRLGCRCAVDNDANLFTLAEHRFGAGRLAAHMVGVTLGTGVGGGLILEGRLYRGADGTAGELGHMVIDPAGSRCGCGRRGCLEAWVGTAAIVRLGRRALGRRAAGPGLTPRLIGDAARAGHARAREVWADVGRRLGAGLANVVNLLNPQRIVIGGGIANNWALFAPALMTALQANAMDRPARTVRVVRGRLGDRAGIVGAAVLVWCLEKKWKV